MTTFNPTTGLELVQQASDLKEGDKYLRAYFLGDEVITCTVETFRSYHSVDHLFTTEASRKIFFLEKVKRHVDPVIGHVGIATKKDGSKLWGFWDMDGDLVTMRDDNNRDTYINKTDIVAFEDKGPANIPADEPEKKTVFRAGQDPWPEGVDVLYDRDGDAWSRSEDTKPAGVAVNFFFSTWGSWERPQDLAVRYSPYHLENPKA